MPRELKQQALRDEANAKARRSQAENAAIAEGKLVVEKPQACS